MPKILMAGFYIKDINLYFQVMENSSEYFDDFPPLDRADDHGLLAVGGDLSARRLINAYQQGIFPWYSQNEPILWWSPDPRCVLYPDKMKISRSLKRSIFKKGLTVTFDQSFQSVITSCAMPRQDPGTWITPEMLTAYCQLHHHGIAHSVEVWDNHSLVGGLYGLSLGRTFFGESMFSHVTDASKVALYWLTQTLLEWEFDLIDCQVSSPHLLGLGAEEIPRDRFIVELHDSMQYKGKLGTWSVSTP